MENQIWNRCLLEADKSVYYLYNLWSPLLTLLLNLANTRERNQQLLNLLEGKSKEGFVVKNKETSAGLVNFKIQLFELQHNTAALHRYLAENIHQPEVLKQSIQFALQSKNWIQVEQLSSYALQQTHPGEEEKILYLDRILEANIHLKQKRKYSNSLINYFCKLLI